MSTSPAAPVSSDGNWPTRKSCAYQSLQPSPIAPACAVFKRADAVGVDDEPVREPVRVLVVEHRRVAAAGDGAEGRPPQVHLHDRRLALGRREHVRVVGVVAVRAGRSAVQRVQQHAVRAREAVEAERRQVVAEAVGEVEGLDGVLLAVGLPRRPRARPRAQALGLAAGRRRTSGCENAGPTRPRSASRDVIVVEVAEGVHVRPGQRRGARGQVAASPRGRPWPPPRAPASAPRPSAGASDLTMFTRRRTSPVRASTVAS